MAKSKGSAPKTSTNRGNEFMAGNQQGRQTMGTSGYTVPNNRSASDFSYGLTPRKTSKGPSPTGTKANRVPTTQDRLGPAFRIQASLPGGQAVADAAKLTQGNTHFMPSAIHRDNINFNYGRQG